MGQIHAYQKLLLQITAFVFINVTMLTAAKAKVELKAKGWSYRKAAPVIGASWNQIYRVVNGICQSPWILDAIASLPSFEEWRKSHD